MSKLNQIIARLEISSTPRAMRPYKPKTATQMLKKTGPFHRMMREAYKRRSTTDKAKDVRLDKLYYRRNKSQIQQRQKRSKQLHKRPA